LFIGDTTTAHAFCDSDETMNSEITSEAESEATVRAPTTTLTPKRRMKPVDDTPKIELPLEISAPSPSARRMRMKRSGRMPLRWKGQETPAVWISSEILSPFKEAVGALADLVSAPKRCAKD